MTINKYPNGPPIWAQNYRTIHHQRPVITVSEHDQHRNSGGNRGGGYRHQRYNDGPGQRYENGGGGYNNRNSNYNNNNNNNNNNRSRSNTSKPANGSSLPYSLFGMTQRDLLTQHVAQWVHGELTKLPTEDLQHIEIEVKLGTITEKNSLKRMRLPVATECVLDPGYKDPSIYFNASVNEVYYKQTVSFLDDLVKTKRSNGDGDKLEAYPTQYNLDLFYDSPWDSSKVRVSLNENNQLVESVNKRTLANLEVYSPGDLVDFRISINLETPVPEQVLSQLQASQTAPKFQREKKRLTYMQSVLKIDLTSVDMPMQQKKKQQAVLGALNKKEDEATKEIEIELNPNVVLECFQLDQDNTTRDASEPGNMELLFGYLLNNTRLIIRNFSRSRGDA